jgi:prevent-host-death family protein
VANRVSVDRRHFDRRMPQRRALLDEVCDGRAPLLITRRNARSVVLMLEEDYDGLMEMVHLANSPADAVHLRYHY